MVRISVGAAAFCIDLTPSTQSDYAAFLEATQGKVVSQVPQCATVTYEIPTLYPSDNKTYGCPPGVYDPAAHGDQPMQCATWCDADAYCNWAGKRLCGRIGGGPTLDQDKEPFDATKDEWYAVCTQGGTTAYPYGDVQDPSCDPSSPLPVDATANTKCNTKDGVAAMIGTVYQWENSCQGLYCAGRGRGYGQPADKQTDRCDLPSVFSRGVMYENIGIRCCADAK